MKPVYKIGNSDDLNASQAVLLIEVGEEHCCFAIVDYANYMMVQSCYYTSEDDDYNDILRKVIEEHKELRQTFRQTVVGYFTPENILIPSKFYEYEQIKDVLGSLFEKGQETTISESIAEWQLYNVYHVPAATHGLLSRNFATGNFWHVYSIILKNGIAQNDGGSLVIDFKKTNFSVIATRNNSLLLAQIFSYSTAADVLYWLLKACKEYSLSQDEVSLKLSGLIDKRSSVYKELHQYFRNLEFALLENDIQLSVDFNEYPVHFFSSIYKLASCVS